MKLSWRMTYLRMPYYYFAFENPGLRLGEFKLPIVLIVLGTGLLLEWFNTKKKDFFVEKRNLSRRDWKVLNMFLFSISFLNDSEERTLKEPKSFWRVLLEHSQIPSSYLLWHFYSGTIKQSEYVEYVGSREKLHFLTSFITSIVYLYKWWRVLRNSSWYLRWSFVTLAGRKILYLVP